MKHIFIIVTLVIVAPYLVLGHMGNNKSTQIPKVHLLYPAPNGSVFDRNCSGLMKTEINDEWVQETVRRTPEFQALWDKEGPAYLSVTFAEVGLEFPYREMQATLTV